MKHILNTCCKNMQHVEYFGEKPCLSHREKHLTKGTKSEIQKYCPQNSPRLSNNQVKSTVGPIGKPCLAQKLTSLISSTSISNLLLLKQAK